MAYEVQFLIRIVQRVARVSYLYANAFRRSTDAILRCTMIFQYVKEAAKPIPIELNRLFLIWNYISLVTRICLAVLLMGT